MQKRLSSEDRWAAASGRLVLAVAACGALFAWPAHGEAPIIVACQGVLTTTSTGTEDLTNYYRVDQGKIQSWDDRKSTWQDDLCSRKTYSCSIGAQKIGAEGAFVGDAKQHVKHTLAIDRVTGKAAEFWIVKRGESMYFEGDCKKSADPALNPAPTKF